MCAPSRAMAASAASRAADGCLVRAHHALAPRRQLHGGDQALARDAAAALVEHLVVAVDRAAASRTSSPRASRSVTSAIGAAATLPSSTRDGIAAALRETLQSAACATVTHVRRAGGTARTSTDAARARRCRGGAALPSRRIRATARVGAAARLRRRSSPSAVTPRTRPPAVTSRSPARAVPAWNTTTSGSPASLRRSPRSGSPVRTARRGSRAAAITTHTAARGSHAARRSGSRAAPRPRRAPRPGRPGQPRHQRLGLGVAEPAVVLEQPRACRRRRSSGPA